MQVENNYSFDITDQIEVGNNRISIVERIQSSKKSEVYKVSIGDIGYNNYGLLKVIKDNNNELENTIHFYSNDSSNCTVEMIAYRKDDNKKFLLLKFYSKGSLAKFIQKNTLSDEEKDALIHNVLEIGCHLHDNNYIHADIKPDNFFIDDENKVRLGDLEFLQQLIDIYGDSISKVCGTKGFKYSQGASYDIQDELFAYIATIYFIETAEHLLLDKELSRLNLKDDRVASINTFVAKKIDSLAYTPLKEFMLRTLDNIEKEDSIDCCKILDEFESLPQRTKSKQPEEEDKKPSNHKKPKDAMVKLWSTHKKPISVITLLIATGLGIFLYLSLSHIPSSEQNSTTIIHPHKPIEQPTNETNETERLPTTTQPIRLTRREKNTSKQKHIKVSMLAKRIASLRTHIPLGTKVLNVDIPSNVRLGHSLKIKISPQNAKGYLQLLLIDPKDTQIFVFKTARYIKNNEVTSISIQTSKPSGLHYILVVFTAKKYNFTLNNYRQIIKNFKNQSFGMEYVNLYPVNVLE